jgi:hypothetical protein
VEVMRVVEVIQATAAAVVATLLEAAVLLEVTVLLLQVAVLLPQVVVIHQAVEVLHREVEDIRLEAAVTPCRQRSQAAVGLHLYRRAKRDLMSALRQTSLI